MSADILANGFLGRQPAWHGLGTIIDRSQSITAEQACRTIGADFEVGTFSMGFSAFGQAFDTNRVAIVRAPIATDPSPAILGYAADGYQVVQNIEIARGIDRISETQGWSLETMGILGKGERFFATLQASTIEIPGDGETIVFFLVTDGKTGGDAMRIATVPVRVVCQNTLKLALSQTIIDAAVTHRGDVAGELTFSMDVVSQMHAAETAVAEAMRLLAKTQVTKDQVDLILEAAYPTPAATRSVTLAQKLLGSTITLEDARRGKLESDVKRHDDWVRTVKLYRDTAMQRFEVFNDEFPGVAMTGWAIANAVAEVEQYRTGKSAVSRGRDMLWGDRGATTERAFAKALAFAGN